MARHWLSTASLIGHLLGPSLDSKALYYLAESLFQVENYGSSKLL